MSALPAVATWGSTADEQAASYPCDDLVERPDLVLFRAVDVAAPADLVFRWLCQLRAAPYSYDWIDNLGRRSPCRLTEGLDRLEVGQRVMTVFRLRSFEPGRSITVDTGGPLFDRVVVTYRVTPTAPPTPATPPPPATSRLVAKVVVVSAPGLRGRLMSGILPAADLLMMRKQLLTLKALAERGVVV